MNALQGDQAVELAAVQDAVRIMMRPSPAAPSLMNDEQLRRIAAFGNTAATASGFANFSRSTTQRHCR